MIEGKLTWRQEKNLDFNEVLSSVELEQTRLFCLCFP